MRHRPPETELEALFRELREGDGKRAPGFQETMATVRGEMARKEGWSRGVRGHRPWLGRKLYWAGGLLAAAAAAALLLVPLRRASDADFVLAVRSYSASPAGGAWRSPTDALLDLPGSDVLTTLPAIGERSWPGSSPEDSRWNQL